MNQDDHPEPDEGMFVTLFLVVSDQDRSRNFYQTVFGGKILRERDPVILEVANTRLILNAGGGPTDDKPTVTLTTPSDPDRVSAFLNIRVADLSKAHKAWSATGAEFLTEPKDHGHEIRAYIRDPDGHLIEVGQTTPTPSSGRSNPADGVRGTKGTGKLMDLQGRPLSSGAARWIDAQFHDLGSGTGEDVRQGAQQEPMTMGHREAAGCPRPPDLMHRPGDYRSVHPVEQDECGLRELEPQDDHGGDDPAGEDQLVLRAFPGGPLPVVAMPVIAPRLLRGHPRLRPRGGREPR